MKLTRKSLKNEPREQVSRLAGDAEDLYRRYLRVQAEKIYFRENDDKT